MPLPETMRIASFNINDINRRLSNLLHWLREAKPDIVCLQELKVRHWTRLCWSWTWVLRMLEVGLMHAPVDGLARNEEGRPEGRPM
jgi:endonuclease/exonuclease/phosphatase family metal-dependent hydrolase